MLPGALCRLSEDGVDPAALDDLLHRARRQEPAALETLVDAYGGRLYAMLRRMTGCPDAAEDLMQETFLRVVRTIGQYEHNGRFEPWLFRIAGNLARDRVRRGRRRGVEIGLDGADDETSAPMPADERQPDPHARVEREEDAARLEAALDRLSPLDREILMLRHYADLPFKEIAEMLAVPLGTALARAHRALQKLRREYES